MTLRLVRVTRQFLKKKRGKKNRDTLPDIHVGKYNSDIDMGYFLISKGD